MLQDLSQHYDGKDLYVRGVPTGWPCLDELYNVVPGELSLVTGGARCQACQ